jgi:hypothetical protein
VTVEDRLRATTEAVTASMRPLRPLDLKQGEAGAQAPTRKAPARRGPAREPRHWPGWLIPVAAAAAVIAVAATLVAVRSLSGAGSGTRSTPASTSTGALSNGIPRYYVSLKDAGTSPKGAVERNAFLADTSAGRQLAVFKPPSDATFTDAEGSSDGRTFVLEAVAGPGFGALGDVRLVTKPSTRIFYVLRLTPDAAKQARLTRIPIAFPTTSTEDILGVAVSPDGRTLAVLYLPGSGITKHPLTGLVTLRTYSIATGQVLRTWPEPAASTASEAGPLSNLTWLDDGRTIAFVEETDTHRYVRTLDTTRPGSNLIADSRAFSAPTGSACLSAQPTADGKSVICGTVSTILSPAAASAPSPVPACSKGGVELAAYSLATGKLERVLYQYQESCNEGSALVVWAKSSTLAIAAIVVTAVAAPHPQTSTMVAAAPDKSTTLPITTWNGFGTIAF